MFVRLRPHTINVFDKRTAFLFRSLMRCRSQHFFFHSNINWRSFIAIIRPVSTSLWPSYAFNATLWPMKSGSVRSRAFAIHLFISNTIHAIISSSISFLMRTWRRTASLVLPQCCVYEPIGIALWVRAECAKFRIVLCAHTHFHHKYV